MPFLRVIFRTCVDKSILYIASTLFVWGSISYSPYKAKVYMSLYIVYTYLVKDPDSMIELFLIIESNSETVLIGPSRIKFPSIVTYKQQ